ncbi:TrgA family protein [Pelagovum pacificum]|uniref:TrgA family protein n=1 Tax=Pelagovum pacificum TaxID=2588711 RepID=A0A5C5GA12_9RHOB|nr:TrgA family protein [Pelagovum pacificum]QQA41532.1 TrgA family protein [Pelagovum pacificum]TNY30812.1 TrgA family protein [Pelagovum pacificum]
MPTFARLAAAIFYAALAWYVSEYLIEPMLPEDADPGRFAEFTAVVGLFCGWSIVGSRAGLGFAAMMGVGLTGAVITLLWAVFLLSFYEMILDSLNMLYPGPMAAVVDVFDKMVVHLTFISTYEIWGTILGVGIIGGIVTEIAGRTYR